MRELNVDGERGNDGERDNDHRYHDRTGTAIQLKGLLTKNNRVDTEGGERNNTGTGSKRAESDRSHSTS